MADEEKDKKKENRPIHGLGLRYHSKYVNTDITIPAGLFKRLKTWTDEHWKLASWRAGITIIALFPTLYGISLGNMTIADKQRISSLEVKAEEGDKLRGEVKIIAETLRLKSVDFDNLSFRVTVLEVEVAVRKQVNEEDGKQLEKSLQLERDKRRKLELEEHNKARAEKLKKIGQADELRANPSLPASETFPAFKGVKND